MGRSRKKSVAQKRKESKMRMQKLRSKMHENDLECERDLNKLQHKQKRALESSEEKREECEHMKEKMRQVRACETPEKKQQRLDKLMERMNQVRDSESPERKRKRLDKVKEGMNQVRDSESPERKRKRLDKVKEGMNQVRDSESPERKRKRLQRQQLYDETKRTLVPPNDAIVQKFLDCVKNACNYICCSCHRLLYRTSVVLLKEGSYHKTPEGVLKNVLDYRKISNDGNEYICRTCNAALKCGKMPAQSKANGLGLVEQPAELKDLNGLELRLISQRIPFMKMVGLPRGKQHGIHGPAVNVPAKLDFVCEHLPRLPSETQIVPLKFKRNLKYRSHYLFDYVRPDKVLRALTYLKQNNPLYADIQINDSWTTDAEKDDPEMWNAMTKPCGEVQTDKNGVSEPETSSSDDQTCKPQAMTSMTVTSGNSDCTSSTLSLRASTNKTSSSSVRADEIKDNRDVRQTTNKDKKRRNPGSKKKSHNVSADTIPNANVSYEIVCPAKDSNMDQLNKLAKRHDMNIVDVPGDGDCLFHAICYHINRLGIGTMTTAELRKVLSDFMSGNPDNYREFVCGLVRSGDQLNVDTEEPSGIDRTIAKIDDVETRKEVQWIQYLQRLESGEQWGEHIALQAMADYFSLSVTVHTTTNMMTHNVSSNFGNRHECHVGLIGQSHYVVFEPCSYLTLRSTDLEQSVQIVTETTGTCTLSATGHRENVDHETEDEKLFEGNFDDSQQEVHVHELLMRSNEKTQIDEDEKMIEEDERSFEETTKVRGLPYETCLMKESDDVSHLIVSVAPGETEKPRPLLSDPNFEELSFPHLYPNGKFALTAERQIKLSPRRFFNQRLLDGDGRFAKSTEYLLSAQYATESSQVQSDINHFVFRRASGNQYHGEKLTVGQVNNVQKMNALIRDDHAYKILRTIRGSPAYFQTVFYDVLAMVRQLGVPTWFFTVSAADMQWPDLIQTIAQQYGRKLSDEDVKNLTFQERSMWLRSNPVTAARHFHYRLEVFFRDVLKSNARPLGTLVDYVIRIEFQARGSPHAHTLLWIKDAPKLDVQSDEEVSKFIDKHITCELPSEDPLLEDLVKRVQTHKHSSYCRKKGNCRFHYPRPPSTLTCIAREPLGTDAEDDKTEAKATLNRVKSAMNDTSTPDDISLEQLLSNVDVSEDDYAKPLKVSQKGSNVIILRDTSERDVNPYNPTLLKAWQANMDIQYIVDAYACVMYVAAYMTKGESGLGELLRQTCREYRDSDIKTMLRRVGSVFLNHRELSAQEAVYRILSIPMKKFSRKVYFVNTDPESERARVLKTKTQLDDMDDDDDDIFQSNIVIRYASRPDTLKDMCLATFAANYVVSYNNQEIHDDSVPQILNEDEEEQEVNDRKSFPQKITLKNSMGRMHKRRVEAVIRFRKFNSATDSSNFYRAKLMLFLPWRDEKSDLIAGYPDFASHYHAVSDVVEQNEIHFTQNLELIDQAIHENAMHGPPEHMWANIAPGTEHENEQSVNDEVVVERNLEQEDLDANASMLGCDRVNPACDLALRYSTEAQREMLSPKEYRSMIRTLNEKQREIVFYHRKWCKEAVVALRNNEPVVPYRIFLSGPGGVGKTHVIKLVHTDTRKLLGLSGKIKPTDVTALLTAPTGVASFNISGMTIHSALLLRVGNYGKGGEPLTLEKLNTLRTNLENLHLLVVDEVSMVGSDMLLNIHKRLDEIKGISGHSVLFGNVSVLAVGDFYQLPPVRQSQIFEPVRDSLANLNGSLWKDNFVLHELTEVVRQKDRMFSNLLCRVRSGQCTDVDIDVLKSREIMPDDPNYPDDALHVFAFNSDVEKRNESKLVCLAPSSDERVSIPASDDKTDSTGFVNIGNTKTQKRSETAGLHTVLVLAIGARVMLTYNVNTSDGLVNGVIGTVDAIIKNANNHVSVVLVKFDDANVGRQARTSSQWRREYPQSTPIVRHEGRYDKYGKKGAQISRRQFPLTLAWAVTIHKCQGLTVDKIVVSMKGANRFGKGQAYVAFSHVKTLEGLFITDFDRTGIKTNKRIEDEMTDMRAHALMPASLPQFMTMDETNLITIGHLNIHYFREKLLDLNSGSEVQMYSKVGLMCFTETYLKQQDDIDDFLLAHNYVAFRENINDLQNSVGHGLMMCAVAQLNPKELNLMKVSGLESKVILIETLGSKLCVALVYRPPSCPVLRFVQMIDELSKLLPLDVPTVVLGDFNENVLAHNKSQIQNKMETFGFVQCVSVPTTDSGSLLDHMYYNKRENLTHVVVDVKDVYYSDHDATFLTIKHM